jgi:hypothetical protein
MPEFRSGSQPDALTNSRLRPGPASPKNILAENRPQSEIPQQRIICAHIPRDPLPK